MALTDDSDCDVATPVGPHGEAAPGSDLSSADDGARDSHLCCNWCDKPLREEQARSHLGQHLEQPSAYSMGSALGDDADIVIDDFVSRRRSS